MAIPESKYIQITSGVGGGAFVKSRSLCTRIFTQNLLAPAGGYVLEFTSADEVLQYFGSTSEEYKRARFYFSYISKNITQPQLISFFRGTPTASAPYIRGGNPSALPVFQTVTAGGFRLKIGDTEHDLFGLDLSAAASLEDVAGILEAAIQDADPSLMWSGSTLRYSSLTNRFNFLGGTAGTTDKIQVLTPAAGPDISPLLNFYNTLRYPRGAVWSDGQAAQTAVDVFVQSVDTSQNYGSYLYLNTLTPAEAAQVAQAAMDTNQVVMGLQRVTAVNASAFKTALSGIRGVGLTLAPLADQYPELLPGEIAAATNYSAPGSTQNYMFQQIGGLTPSVTTGSDAEAYDVSGVNYYGETQSNGQKISFFQPGILTGGEVSTNIVDMNTFMNEAWLKSAFEAELFNLLLSLPKISANNTGRGQIMSVLQNVINVAVLNGTISVDTILNTTQRAFVLVVTQDPNAFLRIQSIGYWFDVVVQEFFDITTKYKAVYTLLYKKDDDIRKIDGSDILI